MLTFRVRQVTPSGLTWPFRWTLRPSVRPRGRDGEPV